jgi:hypothetical protein
MRVIGDHRAVGGSDNAYAPGDLRCIVAIECIKIVARIPAAQCDGIPTRCA